MSETVAPGGDDRNTVLISVDGREHRVDAAATLLDVLREQVGARSVKDGCSPQGQCGCCTVLVDGSPRVACVTPVRRVAGRSVVTLDGLDDDSRERWAEAFLGTGASQCGFCTPGIIMRLAALEAKGVEGDDDGGEAAVGRALAAHLCRCTGWRTIAEAWRVATDPAPSAAATGADRDLAAASRRAGIEGRTGQQVSGGVALGRGGFAADSAPPDALVAVPDGAGGWSVGETLAEARAAAGKRQGRRTTVEASPPLELPGGTWDLTLRTCWVEPAYLETDASWCSPGGDPASALGNGGAFGGKVASPAPQAARRLADEHGRPVRVLLSREDTVRLGPKRPPIAAGIRADGSGIIRVAATSGFAALVARMAQAVTVEEVTGPWLPTTMTARAAGWAELEMLRAGLAGRPLQVHSPEGALAEAEVVEGRIRVRVACGEPLDRVVLRSYCIGATHMALSWLTSEALAVDDDGSALDLTIRSFGVLRALDMPEVEVEIDTASDAGKGEPVNGSDAVFAAVAAAVWIDRGCPQDLPARSTPPRNRPT